MENKFIIVSIIIILTMTQGSICYGQTKYLINNQKEISQLVRQLNEQGIKIAPYHNPEQKFETPVLNVEFSCFNIRNSQVSNKIGDSATDPIYALVNMYTGGAYKFYKVDVNNDGRNEYVLTSSDGSSAWFDIEAIYQYDGNRLKDIFDEIKIPLRKQIRDADKETYDLEEGYVGFMNGDMLINRENGKTFFTIINQGQDHPSAWAYKFLWDKNIIKLIKSGSYTSKQ